MLENSGNTDQTPRSAAFDLGLQCLQTSHKKDARLIWVNVHDYKRGPDLTIQEILGKTTCSTLSQSANRPLALSKDISIMKKLRP